MMRDATRFLVTTVHRGRPLEEAGELLLVDLAEGWTGVVLRSPAPRFSTIDADKAFGGKRGFRGVRLAREQIVVATFDSLLVVDLRGQIRRVISHPLFTDLHGIEIEQDQIWVTSTGNDTLLRLHQQGELLDSWFLAEHLAPEARRIIPRGCDFRRKVLTGMQVHPNYVSVHDSRAFVCCRRLGGVAEIALAPPFRTRWRGDLGHYQLPHDLRLSKQLDVWRMDLCETGTGMLKSLEWSEDILLSEADIDLAPYGEMDPQLPPSRGRTHWLRGLAVLEKGEYLAGQSPARLVRVGSSGARVFRLDTCPTSAVFDIFPYPSSLPLPAFLEERTLVAVNLSGK